MAEVVAIAVLAAGASRRLGRSKQLLPYKGRTLLRHAVETALQAGAGPVLVVIADDALQAELSGLAVRIVRNTEPEEGVAASIRAAVQALEEPPDALILFPVDQPLVTHAQLRQLVRAYGETRHPMAAASYSGVLGAPALFAAELFPRLLALRGEEGARKLLRTDPDAVAELPMPEAACDVDTPEDYDRLLARTV